MKSVKEYIINESEISKEKKEEIFQFVNDYFDKFNKDPKNFLKYKFKKKSNYAFHGWNIESLLNCPDIPHARECKNLLISISKKEIDGKILPDYWDGHCVYLSHFKLKNKRKSLIQRYLGAYKAHYINKREKDPTLLFQLKLKDYNYITNFEKYNNKKILEDHGFLEVYDFTDTNDYEYIDSKEGVTIKVFLWNKFWPIIRFDFENIDEGLKVKSSTNVNKDIDSNKFIICMPNKFIDLNLEQ